MSDENDQNKEKEPFTTGPPGEATDPPSEAASKQSLNGQAKPVSPEKIAANRANAQHSTGPRTAEGKEKASQNSLKHGFFARQPLPNGPEGDKLWLAYKDMVAGIWEYYKPVGCMEELLVEKIATESVRFSRFMAFESDYVGKMQLFQLDCVDRVLRFQGSINKTIVPINTGARAGSSDSQGQQCLTNGTALASCCSHVIDGQHINCGTNPTRLPAGDARQDGN